MNREIDTPKTPPGPNANSEIDLSGIENSTIPLSLQHELDVNSDSEDASESEDTPFEDVPLKSDNEPVDISVEGNDPSDSEASELRINCNPLGETQPTFVNPFGSSDSTRRFVSKTMERMPSKSDPLNSSQQSHFVRYVDQELLTVQRKFIKHLSREGDQSDYPLVHLVSDLQRIVVFIWYSIGRTQAPPVICHDNLLLDRYSGKVEIPVFEHRLQAQPQYIIKIMGDMVDYLDKYDFASLQELRVFLELLAIVDNFVATLFEQKDAMRETEKTRIDSIVNRMRLLVIAKYDNLKDREMGTMKRKQGQLDGFQEYDDLVGEVFEAIQDGLSE